MKRSIQHKEGGYAKYFLSAFLVCLVTALISWLLEEGVVVSRIAILVHVFVGFYLSFISLGYVYFHFKRTLGFRKASLIVSGLVLVVVISTLLLSGVYLILKNSAVDYWLYITHILSVLIFVALLFIHWLISAFYRRKSTRTSSGVLTLKKQNVVGALVFTSVFVLGIFGLSGSIYYFFDDVQLKEVPSDYSYVYGAHPFRPSETDTPGNLLVPLKKIGKSHECKGCHSDIYDQWASSMHKHAASDPTYVTNVTLLAKKKGIEATRYCEGCHAPLALLTGELTPGGEHGGIPNTPANIEGVSCRGCHGIQSLTHLKGVASYEFVPEERSLFGDTNQPFLAAMDNLLIVLDPSKHKDYFGGTLKSTSGYCAACHAQFMDFDINSWGWVKMQDEYSAWLKSPFSHHDNSSFAVEEFTRCQDCHMPLVDSSDPSANKNGKVRSHRFTAANTFVPILLNDQVQLEKVIEFMQSGKMTLSIDKPFRSDSMRSTIYVDENLRGTQESPYYLYLGESSSINVIVSNRGVGHDFPGGTTDINQAWIEVIVHDAEGTEIFSSGKLSDDNVVDPTAHIYHAIAVDRKGNHVWRHDLFNMVGNAFKRVVKSGESDVAEYSLSVPGWAKSPVTITAALKYRKLNERYARWALNKQYVEIPAVTMAWDTLDVPLRTRDEVE